MKNQDHHWFMGLAIEEAWKAYKKNEVPVGAVLVKDGHVISKGHNQKELLYDPCGHAEIYCLKNAGKELKNWRLKECSLYVTLSPCPMCLSAMTHSRLDLLCFGTYDFKGGSIELGYKLFQDQRLNHQFKIIGGIRHFECSSLLSQFFKEKRKGHKEKLI